MDITAQMVKELRERTGAGPKQCRDALLEANGDMAQAEKILEEKALVKGEKMTTSGRATNQGIVYSYIHNGSRIGAMVELACETDFVARNENFQSLAREIALQIVGMKPQYITKDELKDGENAEELVLMEQPFIRDPKKTVQQLVRETAAKVGENITVRRMARFEVGSD